MLKRFLFIFIMLISICSFSYASFDTQFLTKKTTSVPKELLIDGIFEHFSVKTTSNQDSWVTKFEQLKSQILNGNSFSFGIFENLNASNDLRIIYDVVTNGISIAEIPTNKNSYYYKNLSQHSSFFKNSNDFYLNTTIYNNQNAFYSFSNANTIYQILLDQNGNYWEYSSDDFSVTEITPPFNFESNYDYLIRNGSNYINLLKRDYSTSSWRLGNVSEWGDYEYYKFDLIDFTNDYESPIQSYTLNSSRDYISRLGSLGGFLSDITVSSRTITYNRLYKLNIYGSLTDEDNYISLGTYYYKWLPLNAVVGTSSGDTSGDVILNVGSGDFNIQDSTNNIVDSIIDTSSVDDIINEYLSGDTESVASDFGFTAFDNPFTTFLLHILESTYDALTLREDVILSADYKTLHFELNSKDFTLPDSPLRTFIMNMLLFIYIYGNYKYFHYLITLLETAKIDKAIAELGTDEFYDSDIM